MCIYTHKHTHLYVYFFVCIYVYVYVCIYGVRERKGEREREREGRRYVHFIRVCIYMYNIWIYATLRDAVRVYARTREVTRAQERGAPLLDASKYTCDKKRRGEMWQQDTLLKISEKRWCVLVAYINRCVIVHDVCVHTRHISIDLSACLLVVWSGDSWWPLMTVDEGWRCKAIGSYHQSRQLWNGSWRCESIRIGMSLICS